jgi:Ras-related protein Rab-1A
MNDTTRYDSLLKIVLIGDTNVGKTAFFESFLYRKKRTDYPTIGVDFGFKTINIMNNNTRESAKDIKIQLWDTAGQERFRSITKTYYRNADVIILMYSVTNMQSFEHIAEWYENIKEMNETMPKMILIGTKIDITTDRQVSYKEGQELAKKYDVQFMEVSCLDSDNVQNTIYHIFNDAKYYLDNTRKLSSEKQDIRIIQVHIKKSDAHSSSCCI